MKLTDEGVKFRSHLDGSEHYFTPANTMRIEREIGAAQAAVADLTGVAPHCFRAPAGLRNPLLDPVLSSLDLKLAAWTRRPFDTRTGDPQRVLDRLTINLGPGDILLLHDGHAAKTPSGEPVILAVLPQLLQSFHTAGLTPVTLTAAHQ